MNLRIWPRSLATRTAIILLLGLAVLQLVGLAIHSVGRADLQRMAQAEQLGLRVANVYRSVALASPDQRAAALHDLEARPGLTATIDPVAVTSDMELAPFELQRSMRIAMMFAPMPPPMRWHELIIRGIPERQLLVSMRFPDGPWLNVHLTVRPSSLIFTRSFWVAFVLMMLGAAALVAWAVQQFSAPMRGLAQAAERLGMDVNAGPLAERGSAEAQKAAAAFNTMAARIRRFVQDRTFLLTAIGHDLRTPITRLKLRAEWMDDEEQQRKMLQDLDELESMVAATLAFGRDDATAEAPTALDMAELLRTILDEAGDARPHLADCLAYEGPDHQVVRARPAAIKRALTNLVANALNYGGNARVTQLPPRDGLLTILVEDDGPGIPPVELDRVLEPFHRLEASRNRETGGTGLGLPIARNILRAHGGDVVLSNRASGGVKAAVTLPV